MFQKIRQHVFIVCFFESLLIFLFFWLLGVMGIISLSCALNFRWSKLSRSSLMCPMTTRLYDDVLVGILGVSTWVSFILIRSMSVY